MTKLPIQLVFILALSFVRAAENPASVSYDGFQVSSSVHEKKIQYEIPGFELKQIDKNGKVYVSLEEDLLFASGKYAVGAAGVSALNKLATALAGQKDLEILVEGHTDSIPLRGKSAVKDNWDLSVLRATAVVKIMKESSKIDPVRLTAAGRGPYFPVDTGTSKASKAKNRRIEVILTPDLDALYKLLESN